MYVCVHVWNCAVSMYTWLREWHPLPWVQCLHTPLTAYPTTHPPTHTHTLTSRRATHLPPGGERGVWERESDWLSGLAFVSNSLSISRLQFHCCGRPCSLACCLISDPHTPPGRPARSVTTSTSPRHINKQIHAFPCLFFFVAKCKKIEEEKMTLIPYLPSDAKGGTAAFASHFSPTALLPHLLLLQHMRGRWITVQLVCCSSRYASPLSNQMKPTCDQPADNTNMQTVYTLEDLPFPSLPEPVLKPLTVPRFGALGLMRRICGSGTAFNSPIKASDVVVPLNPHPLPSNPWDSFTHRDICLFLTSHTASCW